MNATTGSYQVVDLPPERRMMPIFNDLNGGKHTMYALLDVDVTVARQFIAAHKARTGETLSFTGFLAYCLARTVDEDRSVQAYLNGRARLVVFDDVDIGLMVERPAGATRVLTGYVVRGANRKRYNDIHHEIRAVQAQPPDQRSTMPRWFRLVLVLPWPFVALAASVLRAVLRRNPQIPVALSGTVGITAIGMFGEGQSGWGLSPAMHSLDLIVGSIARKPAVVAGRIVPREILNLTVVFDHDVIDGAPAARFTRRLVERIQRGDGLIDEPPADRAAAPPVPAHGVGA